MKVLFLCDASPDYLQDALFHGLRTIAGADVVEFPPNPRYRSPPALDEPRPFLCFDVGTHPGGTLDELLADAGAVVAASLREGALPHVRRALELRPDLPWAFVDGEDHPYVHGVRSQVDLYFKRETLVTPGLLRARTQARRPYHFARNRAHGRDPLRRQVAVAHRDNVIPLPFGIVDVGFEPPAEKDFDVAFMARPSSPERERVLSQLQRVGLRVATGAGLPWREYMDVLARSRIGVSVRGLGYDTYRYWEIPYAGAVLAAETPRIVIPDGFVDGEEVFYESVDRLDGLVTAICRLSQERLSEVAAAAREKLLARHTSVHRAQAVLDRLASIA